MDINSFFKLFLAVSLGVGFAAFAVNNSQVRSSREVLQAWDERSAPKVKLSSWMWESVADMPEEDQISLLSQSKEQHIARIFLDIEEYITLTEKDDIEGINNLKRKLTFFISEAKSRDIEVYALAGDVSWIFEDYRYIPKKLVEFVNEFNAMSQEEKFAGIQFDIEYYNSNEYKDAKDKTKVQFSKDYLDMVKNVKELSDIPVGFAIPYWFNRDDELMKISYNDKNRTIFRHLIDILEVDHQSKTNHLAIMSYRRKTVGNNGTIKIVEGLFNSSKDRNISLYVGQATSTTTENVSFLDNERQELMNAVRLIDKEFVSTPQYAGVAIHHLTSYLNMDFKND